MRVATSGNRDTGTGSSIRKSVPWSVQTAVYATGAFSHSLNMMANVAIPLWVVSLGASPAMAGIALGARYVLLVALSIQGGALMDRLGTRRTMLVLGIASIAAHFAYPALPWIAALILLQAVAGLAGAAGWLGSQVLIGQHMQGDATYTGRLSFSLRIGAFVGPPLVGIAWDHFGPWGAFGVLALWAAAGALATLAVPKDPQSPRRIAAADLLPRRQDYVDTIRLLAVPAIALVVAVTVLRHTAVSVQHSFYVVWLDLTGISGTQIGTLVSAWAILGSVTALAAGPLSRAFSERWLIIATVSAQIVLISATPLLPSYAALFVAMALYGGAMGVSQPLMISLMTRLTGAAHHGKSAGLRTAASQFASVAMPPVMGAIALAIGLEASFYVVGGVLIVAMCVVAAALNKRTKSAS